LQSTLQQNGSAERSRGVVIPKEKLNKTSKEGLDVTLKEKLDVTSKEELNETSDEDETQVDISGSRQVDSSGNQDQATDQEELNPQDDDTIGPQASKDDPPPALPTPAQLPEPRTIPSLTNKLVISCQGIPACRYAVIAINTTTDAFPTDIDPFTYNTTSHYTSTKFMGVIIDTRASKRSTAGYNQFLAFQRLDTGVQLNTTTQGIG
jgi:hypothetical protein